MSEIAPVTVRTRFAPSPTGYLHVGGARTALFCWLFARRHGGQFLLRIEDTDQRRNVAEAAQAIFDGLAWLGLDWDEPPVYQSQRLEIYDGHFKRLIESGRAYECFMTPEELERKRAEAQRQGRYFRYDRRWAEITDEQRRKHLDAGRVPVLRFRMPDIDITVEDAVLGAVTTPAAELEDFVIRKADGFPVYHFAVVIDDAAMNVSHVIRGVEHLGNTPRHVALQDALGLPRPVYAHLPILLNPDGSKMSKRQVDDPSAWAKGLPPVRVRDYQGGGCLPEAMVNFLALLGWNPGDGREIISRDELTAAFSLDRVNKTNSRWDAEKLTWMNQRYFQQMAPGALVRRIGEFLGAFRPDHPAGGAPAERIERVLPLYRERAHSLAELADGCAFLFAERVTLDESAVKKVLLRNDGEGLAHLRAVRPLLAGVELFDAAALEAALKVYCEQSGAGLGKVAQPIRVAVSGGTVSPPIFETLEVLGKERTLARIDEAIATATAIQAGASGDVPPASASASK